MKIDYNGLTLLRNPVAGVSGSLSFLSFSPTTNTVSYQYPDATMANRHQLCIREYEAKVSGCAASKQYKIYIQRDYCSTDGSKAIIRTATSSVTVNTSTAFDKEKTVSDLNDLAYYILANASALAAGML